MKVQSNITVLFSVILILSVVFLVSSPHFFTFQNILNILVATSTIGILAVGAAFVIGAAGLDLSAGSVMALSATVAGVITVSIGLPWPFTIIICLLTGALIGMISGSLIGFRAIPAFIVTLGMLSIARGLSFLVTDGYPIYGLSNSIVFIGQGSFLSIPIPVLIFIGVCLIGHTLLKNTSFGRHTLAIGDNEEAARNAGISIGWHQIKLYAFSGLLAAIAGLIFMGRVNAADPNAGVMYELTAIAAAIIGGTSLSGGKTSVIGAMLGALIMGILQNGLNLLTVPAYYQQLAIGIILILAVSLKSTDFTRRGAS